MKKIILFISLVCLFFPDKLFSQNKKIIDSLEHALQLQKEDTVKANILAGLCVEHSRSNPVKSMDYGFQALKLSEKLNFKSGEAKSTVYIGIGNYLQGKYDTALICFKKGLTLATETKNAKLTTKCLVNMGLVNAEQGKQAEALQYYYQGLSIAEKSNDYKGIGGATGNIGNIYFQQNNFDKALECFKKAVENYSKINDVRGVSNNMLSIGVVYKEKKEYEKALENDLSVLKIFEEQGDKNGLSRTMNNLGVVYNEMHDFGKAQFYYESALKMQEEINDQRGICFSLNNLGLVYLTEKKYEEAFKCFNRSLDLSKKIGDLEEQSYNYEGLANYYKEKHDFEKAYENYVMFKKTNDSIFTKNSADRLNELSTQYETAQKEQKIELLNKENEVKAADLKNEKIRRYALYAGLLLLIVFIGFVLNRFKISQKQKRLIEIKNKETELQKEIIEAKQKEIIDSITYARRIQRSLLPTEKYINNSLNRLKKK